MKSLLIVDDEPVLREMVELKLRKYFQHFFHANNGKEGLEELERHPEIDIVLSDVRMPIMDGLEFIKKARNQGIEKPFIFFTAFASREVLNEVVKYGVQGFIDKSSMGELVETIMATMGPEDVSLEDVIKKIEDF